MTLKYALKRLKLFFKFTLAAIGETTLRDVTTYRCYQGFAITLRCETDVVGRLDILNPENTYITRGCSFVDNIDTERYSLDECGENEYTELVIRSSNYKLDEGEWSCLYNGGSPSAKLEVSTRKCSLVLKKS